MSRKQTALVLPEVLNLLIITLFCCRKNSFGLCSICATTWVYLWFVADYRWDERSGGKVLKLTLGFVLALDD